MVYGLVGETVFGSTAAFITFSFPTGKGIVTNHFVAELISLLFNADCLPLAKKQTTPLSCPPL